MRNLLIKEIRLAASPLSFWFIAFGWMFLLPGYPVLLGSFFVCMGIFQSFQKAREAGDIVFSVLLPVAKKDTVRAKFVFSCLIELCGFVLMLISVLLRMTVWADLPAYRNNALMNANPFALGMALLIFGLFNLIFIGGFFRTAYRFDKPFILFCIAMFLTVGLGEALHHFPGLEALNAFGFEHAPLQWGLFAAGAAVYVLLTAFSLRRACRHFERIDL